jgi:hypothetical protein
MQAKISDQLTSLLVRSFKKPRRSILSRSVLFGWPAIALLLVCARLMRLLVWPWIIVLAPVWLPPVVFTILLVCAMWLDKLSD